MPVRLLLLALVPIAPLLQYGGRALWPGMPAWVVFVAGAAGIGVLADWVKRATEHLAHHAGPAIGGLVTVSFGSIAELVLALFVLADGQAAVVRAQVTGSIMATSLLGLGLAVLAGSVGRRRQRFDRENAGLLSSMLVLTLIALLLPAVFDLALRTRGAATGPGDEALSLGVAAILLLLYAGNLAYTLVTHSDVFAGEEAPAAEAGAESPWSLSRALLVLVAATLAIAWDSEIVSSALEATGEGLGLSTTFLGVVALAVVGTSADLFAAVGFARADRMGLVLSICVGSAIQMALVVAPALVLLSWAIGHPMTLVFAPLDLFAIAACALIVNSVAGDGETTWFEGLLLVGVYVLLALGFFFVGA
ncbi:MAG: calcium/proton exchanger [Janthinobacterium lividum]